MTAADRADTRAAATIVVAALALRLAFVPLYPGASCSEPSAW